MTTTYWLLNKQNDDGKVFGSITALIDYLDGYYSISGSSLNKKSVKDIFYRYFAEPGQTEYDTEIFRIIKGPLLRTKQADFSDLKPTGQTVINPFSK